MDIVFEKWREKLLDAGKGNRLINFKETSRSLEVLAPDYETIFNKISNGDELSFYDVDTFVKEWIKEKELQEGDGEFDVITKQEVYDALSSKLKRNQILSFKKGSTLQRTLKNIKKVSIDSLLEKGINILYMAFGFLKWKEKDNASQYFSSPLILIPIHLNSIESKNPVFSITQYEDEINTNPTLSYLMKHEYNIVVPEFQDELHQDETLTDYISRVKEEVEFKGWDVSYKVSIGTFSFLKMNMYKDLEENEALILENNNVKKLLNRKVSNENVTTIDFDEYFRQGKELGLHNVVDADSSQMRAIIKAQSGNSFVLQGPPGTGKSQTITNLIAEFLYNDKKILFVSEKLEALNVVFNNLKKVGLEDFCLELHSHKTNKKEVINELHRVLNKNKTEVATRASEEVEDLKKSKLQLDNYNTALHTIIPVIDKTPYEIISEITNLNNEVKEFEYAINRIETKGSVYLKDAIKQLTSYANFTDSVGYDYHLNSWYGFNNFKLSYYDKQEFKNKLYVARELVERLYDLVQKIDNKFKIKQLLIEDVNNNKNLLQVISKLEFFDKNIFNNNKLKKIYNSVTTFNLKQTKLNEDKKVLSRVFNDEIYELNISDYYVKFKNEYLSVFRIFNKNYRRDIKVMKGYYVSPKTKLSYNDIIRNLKLGKNIQQAEKELASLKDEIYSYLDNKEAYFNFDELQKELKALSEVLKCDLESFAAMNEQEFRSGQEFIKDYLIKLTDIKEKLNVINELQVNFDTTIVNFNKYGISDLIDVFNLYIDEFESLENWIRFNATLNDIDVSDLRGFVDKAIEYNINPNVLCKTYKLMFFTQWMHYILSQNKTLGDFTRISQDLAVQNFKKKDKLKFEISKAEIIAKLSSERPSNDTLASGSQVSTLLREASKKRKQKPVRLLLQSISELVQTLKPCFLMSPLSVSTYLTGDSCKFDVVIFDEASQIFPWDAVGAIYRAKQVIVVGDSKQMPPSNYFNVELVDENDDDFEEDDSLDFESILDLCATAFEQERLSWHYRSRTEDLIAFSNKNFYDGSLVTFPSASKDNANNGVDFYYVEDGIFDRKTKTNVIEANKVVDLVFDHIKNNPHRSLGVVAFSISQQSAIEAAIQERREKDDKYADFFDSNKPERFFVKNLETVQGDERDTIIFSVAYAKDKDGKFLHNFGPLNKKGGERRLNVAVTRAKYNVKLVSSIKSYDIDLSKTESVGARLLKEYLEFAQVGVQSLNVDVKSTGNNTFNGQSFEDEVYDTLINAGYNAIRNVGYSDYRIDIAIKHPTKPDYILAIECDGKNYHLGKTTRDRDRLRQEVLERLGWNYYRVWSTDWFANHKLEKAKLLDVAASALENFNNNKSLENVNSTIDNTTFLVEQKARDLKSEFNYYQIHRYKGYEDFDKIIYNLVKQEAPITEELLLKRTLHYFGNEKITSYVKARFLDAMAKHSEIRKKDDYYYVDENQVIEMRIPKMSDIPREISQIPIVELASGINKVVELNIGINKEGLFKTVASLLGFTRAGDNMRLRLEKALTLELNRGNIKEENGEYFIK